MRKMVLQMQVQVAREEQLGIGASSLDVFVPSMDVGMVGPCWVLYRLTKLFVRDYWSVDELEEEISLVVLLAITMMDTVVRVV